MDGRGTLARPIGFCSALALLAIRYGCKYRVNSLRRHWFCALWWVCIESALEVMCFAIPYLPLPLRNQMYFYDSIMRPTFDSRWYSRTFRWVYLAATALYCCAHDACRVSNPIWLQTPRELFPGELVLRSVMGVLWKCSRSHVLLSSISAFTSQISNVVTWAPICKSRCSLFDDSFWLQVHRIVLCRSLCSEWFCCKSDLQVSCCIVMNICSLCT